MAKRDARKEMEAIRELIRQKKYEEARSRLIVVDHPTADKWLKRLNEIAPLGDQSKQVVEDEKPKKKKGCLRRTIEIGFVGTLIICALSFAGLLLGDPDTTDEPTAVAEVAATDGLSPTPSDTPVPSATPTITNTPAPTATVEVFIPTALPEVAMIEEWLSTQSGYDIAELVSVRNFDDGLSFAAHITVYPGHNNVDFAEAYKQQVVNVAGTRDIYDIEIIISDGEKAISYYMYPYPGDWSITELTSVDPPTPRPRQ